MISLIYEIQNVAQMNLSMKQKQTHSLVVAKVDSGMGVKGCEFGVSRYKLLSIGWINSKVLLHSTGNILNIL